MEPWAKNSEKNKYTININMKVEWMRFSNVYVYNISRRVEMLLKSTNQTINWAGLYWIMLTLVTIDLGLINEK